MPRKKKTDTDQSKTETSSYEEVSLETTTNTSTDLPEPPTYNNSIAELVDQESTMPQGKHPVNVRVSVRQGESIEQMLRRFNFAVNKTEIIQKLKDKQYYEKPSKAKQRELKTKRPFRTFDK